MKTIIYLVLFLTVMVKALAQQGNVNSQVTIQQEAMFPGGDAALIKYIYENIHWPETIKGNVIDEQLILSLDVRPDSMPENFVYLKKVGYGIDEQIVEMLKRVKFIPSIQNNIPVKMNIILNIPIQYRKK